MNKKKQKNFDSLKHLALTEANPTEIRSFLLLFFKKEALYCVSKQSLRRWRIGINPEPTSGEERIELSDFFKEADPAKISSFCSLIGYLLESVKDK